MLNTTLCYIEKEGEYLMLLRNKKKTDPSKGKWIGVGGKFEPGETPEQCLLREVKEETGLTLTSYKRRALITFISDEWEDEYMYLYTADGFEGTLSECELADCDEGKLAWIAKKDIFNLNLWEGDKHFLKMLIEDKPYFEMKLVYKGEQLAEITVNEKACNN